VTPLVTIMVPVYNGERTIARAVASALAEPYESLEVIVADDASTDATAAAVRPYIRDPRLRYLRRDDRLGRVPNYRRTLYHDARGRYVLNLDGDDWLLGSTFLRDAVAMLEEDADRVLAIGLQQTYLEAEGRSFVQRRPLTLPTVVPGETIMSGFADGLRIPHLAALFRRDEARAIDFYRTDLLSSDAESFLRLVLGRQVVVLEHVVGAWRIHDGNASHLRDDLDHCFEGFDVVDAVYEQALACGTLSRPELDAWRHRCKANFAYAYVADHVKTLQLGTAARYLRALRGREPEVFRAAVLDPRRPVGSLLRRLGRSAR